MGFVITYADDNTLLVNGAVEIIVNGVPYAPIVDTPDIEISAIARLDKLFKIVKDFESFFSEAYLCPAKVWTIGWGTIKYKNGVKVKKGDVITAMEAQNELEYELQKCYDYINKNIKTKLNDNQLSALISFIYNCGEGALSEKWSIGRAVRDGNLAAIPNLLMAWINAKGQALAGLWRRRASEALLFQGYEAYIIPYENIPENWRSMKYFSESYIKLAR